MEVGGREGVGVGQDVADSVALLASSVAEVSLDCFLVFFFV